MTFLLMRLDCGIILYHVPAKLFYMSLNVTDIMIHNTVLCGLPISFKKVNHTFADTKATLISKVCVNRQLERINVQKLDNQVHAIKA